MDLQGRSISSIGSANLNRAGLKPVVGPVRNWRLRAGMLCFIASWEKFILIWQ